MQDPDDSDLEMTTLNAQDVISQARIRRAILPAPNSYAGTLQEFATAYVIPNLLEPSVVTTFHERLTNYLEGPDPLFLIRALSQTTRGQIYRTDHGNRWKATDNAPAWWVHFVLFHELDLPHADFASIIETLPTHFFEVASQVPENVSAAGWHVAHIFGVKDRNTDYQRWSTAEVVRRCVRNIHPCNYFTIPKTEWQAWGGNERVISYFAALYKDLYGPVWDDFLFLSGADSAKLDDVSGPIEYRIQSRPSTNKLNSDAHGPEDLLGDTAGTVPPVSYRASRLLFKANVIERLKPDSKFRIVTPVGTFEMSKAEFYSAFPNVVSSRSYMERGAYHYPRVPAAALRFKVGSES